MYKGWYISVLYLCELYTSVIEGYCLQKYKRAFIKVNWIFMIVIGESLTLQFLIAILLYFRCIFRLDKGFVQKSR